MDCTKVTKESLIEDIKNNAGLSMASFCKEIRKRKELLEELEKITSFAPSNSSVAFRCYLIANGFTEMPKCKFCGKILTNRKLFCSRNCSNNFYSKNEETQLKKSDASKKMWEKRSEEEKNAIYEKVKQTNLEHWGVECNFNSEETIQKRQATWNKKYGTDHPSQSNLVKEKTKKTNLERRGVEYPMQSKEVLEKRQSNNREKYGVNEPCQLDEVKEKIVKINIEKYGCASAFQNEEVKRRIKNTCIEKYGVDNPMKNDEIKERAKMTCIEKYGVDNPSKSDVIKEKIRRTFIERYGESFIHDNTPFKHKTFVYDNVEIDYMGYEKPVLEKLFNEYEIYDIENSQKFMKSFDFYYEKEDGTKHKYIPDIYVKSTDTFYEVKGEWLFVKDLEDKNILRKANAVINAGHNFIFVLSNDGINFKYYDYKNFIKLYANE